MSRKIEAVNTDDLPSSEENLIIKTKKKKESLKGRPKKFSQPIITHIKIGLTEKQLQLISERMINLNQKVKVDYIRSLIAKDIESFEY